MSFWMEGGLNQLARSGDLAGVLRLLDSGVPVDFIENGRFSDSPLMEAARGGHLEVMQLLLDRGADVNHSDNDSFTPVTAAGGSEQWLALRLLARHGGNFESLDATGHCGLDYLRQCPSKLMRKEIEDILSDRD